VLIQRNGNVAFDVTDAVHPDVAAMATLAARVVGLDIAGIDLVAEDISRPLQEQRGAIIEVNASPGLLAHIKPASGTPRAVGAAIVDHLFATGENGRIPVVGIAGSRGTTRIAQLVAWIYYVSGRHTGLASRNGLTVNGRNVPAPEATPWEAAQRLLVNRAVEAAVFENDSRMILSEGLPYDRCAVGVVTDAFVQPELAEFYIDRPEQVFNVLRTQVDVVLPDGVAVLNAADARVAEMASLCDGRVLFYGLARTLAPLAAHRHAGGRAVFLHRDSIVLADGAREAARVPMPAGTADPEPVVAAVAAAWAAGIDPQLISAGLRTFAPLYPRMPSEQGVVSA
ncbi:MAG TPA: cyanophycin synthetase, partial [Noviherbaspirillum sp.]|nr:cyanophycin synthetase [Noviherbaspirillum sp.]